MFENFSPKAIRSIMLAQEESRRLSHPFVGTEQILLGLIRGRTDVAAKVLNHCGVELNSARIEVENIIGKGSGVVVVEVPLTPNAKTVLELAIEAGRE